MSRSLALASCLATFGFVACGDSTAKLCTPPEHTTYSCQLTCMDTTWIEGL
ncbi:MAG: hypothetical protein ABJE66_25990 [Deltaproteobacteria bacterium]